MIGDDVAIVGERFVAKSANAVLGDDLPIKKPTF